MLAGLTCTAVYEVLAMGVCACTRTTRIGLRSRTDGWGWGGRKAVLALFLLM